MTLLSIGLAALALPACGDATVGDAVGYASAAVSTRDGSDVHAAVTPPCDGLPFPSGRLTILEQAGAPAVRMVEGARYCTGNIGALGLPLDAIVATSGHVSKKGTASVTRKHRVGSDPMPADGSDASSDPMPADGKQPGTDTPTTATGSSDPMPADGDPTNRH